MKKIVIGLNPQSIDAAIKELKAYKLEIAKKTQELIERMVEYGEDYALNILGHVDTGETLASVNMLS